MLYGRSAKSIDSSRSLNSENNGRDPYRSQRPFRLVHVASSGGCSSRLRHLSVTYDRDSPIIKQFLIGGGEASDKSDHERYVGVVCTQRISTVLPPRLVWVLPDCRKSAVAVASRETPLQGRYAASVSVQVEAIREIWLKQN